MTIGKPKPMPKQKTNMNNNNTKFVRPLELIAGCTIWSTDTYTKNIYKHIPYIYYIYVYEATHCKTPTNALRLHTHKCVCVCERVRHNRNSNLQHPRMRLVTAEKRLDSCERTYSPRSAHCAIWHTIK